MVFKKLNNQSQNSQHRRYGEKANIMYETYKNTVMPDGNHIYSKTYDILKATICAYPQSYHALPHWKCVMRYCAKYKSINTPDQETYNQYSNTSTSISFHIYHLSAHCTTHDRIPLTDKKDSRK